MSTGHPGETQIPSGTEALVGGLAVLPSGPNAPLAPTSDAPVARSLSSPDDVKAESKGSTASLRHDPYNDLPSGNEASTDASPAEQITPQPHSMGRLIFVAGIVTCTMALGAAGAMGLTISLPAIQRDLGMAEADLQWVSSVYNLTAGCFLLLAGRIADIHGRKLVFVIGVSWIALWTLIGSFMNSGAALVITRALAGMGSAMSTPSAIGIIAGNFKGRARSSAFAAFAAGAPVGGALGLVMGGLLTAYSSDTWRTVLRAIAGVAGLVTGNAIFVIPRDTRHVADKRVDWLGAAFITVGLIFIMFVVSAGSTAPNGWATGYIIAMLILGVLFIACFFTWEYYVQRKTTRPPLMRLQLWTRAKGKLASVYFIGGVTWMCFSALFYHATLFYQQVQMTGPIGAMLRFIPTSVCGVLCNVLVAIIINKIRTQWIICTGILSTGLASVLFALSDADTVYWRMPFNGMWMAVLGADFLMATGSTFVAALANPEEQSVAGAVFQTMIQLGGSFGLALTTVINTTYQTRALERGANSVDALLEGLHAAFWLGAGFAGAALILAVVMLRGMGTIGSKKRLAEAEENVRQRTATGEDGRGGLGECEDGQRGEARRGNDKV